MQNIDISQVKHKLPQLLEQDIEEAIIITKQGLPIAKVIGISKKKKQREFGSAKGLIKMADDFDAPLEDFKEYM
ncbi:type II toxin-antitoxin system prevent-host-death family antitoxin [uncultured Desulfobacter sp.]|uniref:type II toxin-antitoxin system Phd/YefM family antitoxin n=1 Tax=uncultured Desulfobacter sp. TaxID=240139 RepID=UPI0029F5B652|nr:type II toxin-antitoxin system prevent-host-death family antitoxin [uncultured Desulfobacter sp.]